MSAKIACDNALRAIGDVRTAEQPPADSNARARFHKWITVAEDAIRKARECLDESPPDPPDVPRWIRDMSVKARTELADYCATSRQDHRDECRDAIMDMCNPWASTLLRMFRNGEWKQMHELCEHISGHPGVRDVRLAVERIMGSIVQEMDLKGKSDLVADYRERLNPRRPR